MMTWNRGIVTYFLIFAVYSVACTSATTEPSPHLKPDQDWCKEGMVCVLVEDCMEPPRPIVDATVFIQNQDGKKIAETSTDKLGQAFLPLPASEERAKYVLVDAEGYFVGGVRWIEGSREYYILLPIATLR